MKFRKKPVVIEAVQFSGSNSNEIIKWAWQGFKVRIGQKIGDPTDPSTFEGLIIPTLEGEHLAKPKDWIIKGVKGEFYPCKPDIFEMTYEAVEKE